MVLAIAAGACDAPRDDAAEGIGHEEIDTAGDPGSASRAGESGAGTAVPPAPGIRPDGIAHVSPGMTIGELRAALPAGITLGDPEPYMVDVDGMPVVAGDDTMYVVLIVSGESSGDDARINLVATTDTTLRTAEGIGPGSTLAAAAAAYGRPTLSYSTNDESREHATFPRLPQTIRFRVRPVSDDSLFAGDYDTTGEYNETGRFDPDAVVSMAMVLIP